MKLLLTLKIKNQTAFAKKDMQEIKISIASQLMIAVCLNLIFEMQFVCLCDYLYIIIASECSDNEIFEYRSDINCDCTCKCLPGYYRKNGACVHCAYSKKCK